MKLISMCDDGWWQKGPGQADKDKQNQDPSAGTTLVQMSTNSCIRAGMKIHPRSSPVKMEKLRLNLLSRESSRGICLQVLPPQLLAGLAMLGAGMLLDHLQVSEE